MEKTYDELIAEYEKIGKAPIAKFEWHRFFKMWFHKCPYCNVVMYVDVPDGTVIHCPTCCMEIVLEK